MFATAIDSVLNILTQGGAKGAVINIPDVTAIAYFTTIPAKGLPLNATQASQLNAAYAGTGISFNEGLNYFVIADASVPVIKRRQLKEGELLLLNLPQDSIRCGTYGTITPIPDQYVLDATEKGNVQSATMAFNAILLEKAVEKGLAFVDMNKYMKTLKPGILFNGVGFTSTYVTGGAFSLDGVHLTPRGYALAANEIIRSINLRYGATVPTLDVNSYNGLLFP